MATDLKPILFGALINCTMAGMLLNQITTYFTRYKKDSMWLKCLVAFSGALSFSSSALVVTNLYNLTILEFGDDETVHKIVSPEFIAYMLMPSIQSATVQLFFGWRASRFIGSRAFFVGTAVSAILQIASGCAGVIVDIYKPERRTMGLDPTCIVWNSLASLTDISISTILVYHFVNWVFTNWSEQGHVASDNLLSKLARFTLQTGILTAGWAVVALVLYIIMDNDDHLPVALVMAQTTLYANVLVAALNCRIHRGTSGDELRKTSTCHDSSSMGVDELQVPVSQVTFMSLGARSQPVTIGPGKKLDSVHSFGVTETATELNLDEK